MPDPSLLSVGEAADRLDIGPAAVRQRIASGRLPAIKRGRSWWLDERVVEGMSRQPLGAGRPLSAEMAWAVLLLASGAHGAAEEAAGRSRYWSRVRAWLRDHPLRDHATRLRARAVTEQFEAHPSELVRILRRPDVLVTGASAGEIVGLVGSAATIELYAPAGSRAEIIHEHGLVPGPGSVRLRWVSNALWPLLDRDRDRRAPRVAILIDLLEGDDPRGRREASRRL